MTVQLNAPPELNGFCVLWKGDEGMLLLAAATFNWVNLKCMCADLFSIGLLDLT